MCIIYTLCIHLYIYVYIYIYIYRERDIYHAGLLVVLRRTVSTDRVTRWIAVCQGEPLVIVSNSNSNSNSNSTHDNSNSSGGTTCLTLLSLTPAFFKPGELRSELW